LLARVIYLATLGAIFGFLFSSFLFLIPWALLQKIGKYSGKTYTAWLSERGYNDAVWRGTAVVGEGPAEGVVGLRDWNQLGVALGVNSLLARYFISAFQAFESKKWLYNIQNHRSKSRTGNIRNE
jgi:hypothetical protein